MAGGYPPGSGFTATIRARIESDWGLRCSLPNSIDDLFKLGNMFGRHTDPGANHDAIESFAGEAVQNGVTQASIRSNGKMHCFPTPISHHLRVSSDTFGHECLGQTGWNGWIASAQDGSSALSRVHRMVLASAEVERAGRQRGERAAERRQQVDHFVGAVQPGAGADVIARRCTDVVVAERVD